MIERIREKLDAWVLAALESSSPPEGLEWDSALILLPNPQGGMQPAFMLLMSIPSPLLGERLPSAGIGFNPHTLNEETVKKMVSDGLTGLYNARSEALSTQLPETNGHREGVIGKSVEWPPNRV